MSSSLFLGKMALLLTSKAKRTYAAEACNYVSQTLFVPANQTAIKNILGQVPRGYILVTDTHPSASDPTPHYTVDAYGLDANGRDKPLGCIHVYANQSVQLFRTPRRKAQEAYQSLVGSP